ncbi:hypothetical protein CEP52_007770 [Fusarium oligoseptatum]|uniref:Heterokaryon incompatibility domain-containing protein n=1 Tax=Fusarium oligoseptatum TaxID=2604345 RepID=A0A428TLE4_9HYPO|nr:hypothetical protein CEP52_007770 [Fusarium oligoseptatum]
MAMTDQMCLDNAASTLIPHRPINLDPASRSSFGLARGWFQTCLADHPKCPKPSLDFMPKRVISISQNQSEFTLRLIETEGIRDLYCALSYCWGGDQKDQGYKGDPPTVESWHCLRQASSNPSRCCHYNSRTGSSVFVCGLALLLQDDKEDMHTQIAQMSEIYSEAAVTILASRAKGVEFSFLHQR